jgi:hypothetical protein
VSHARKLAREKSDKDPNCGTASLPTWKMKSAIAFCLSEDREIGETGLRLAILSLRKHCPGTPIYVYRPSIFVEFSKWVAQLNEVIHVPERPFGADSWNCKPQALLPLLESGHREAVWIDSDMLLTRDFRNEFGALSDETLVATQEPSSQPNQGTEVRTRGWNLEVGHSLSFTLNSSVIRVTRHHARLLEDWTEMLNNPEYRLAQHKPIEQRPIHLASDQDILNALVGSQPYREIPLYVLYSGKEIIHAGGALGYCATDRLSGLFRRKPTFIHAMAGKPWLWLGKDPYWAGHGFFGWRRRLLQELSPYVAESRQYRNDLGLDTVWMDHWTAYGVLFRALGFGHFAMRGLPLTIAATFMSFSKRAVTEAKY